jgi:hypothetical protein
VQWLTGVVVDQWPGRGGRHPAEAYQAAFGINLAIQALAFAWFVVAGVRATEAGPMHQIPQCLSPYRARPQRSPYRQAHMAWLTELSAARTQVANWRGVAIASMALSVVLTTLALPGFAAHSEFKQPFAPLRNEQAQSTGPSMISDSNEPHVKVEHFRSMGRSAGLAQGSLRGWIHRIVPVTSDVP